jgi:hypothetical protein
MHLQRALHRSEADEPTRLNLLTGGTRLMANLLRTPCNTPPLAPLSSAHPPCLSHRRLRRASLSLSSASRVSLASRLRSAPCNAPSPRLAPLATTARARSTVFATNVRLSWRCACGGAASQAPHGPSSHKHTHSAQLQEEDATPPNSSLRSHQHSLRRVGRAARRKHARGASRPRSSGQGPLPARCLHTAALAAATHTVPRSPYS